MRYQLDQLEKQLEKAKNNQGNHLELQAAHNMIRKKKDKVRATKMQVQDCEKIIKDLKD